MKLRLTTVVVYVLLKVLLNFEAVIFMNYAARLRVNHHHDHVNNVGFPGLHARDTDQYYELSTHVAYTCSCKDASFCGQQKSCIFISVYITCHDCSRCRVKPGPYKPKYPRQLCDKAVKWGQRGVRCDTCLEWYHTDCMGMGTRTYEELDGSRIAWFCTANFSAGHLFSHSSTEASNSFGSLSFLSNDGSQTVNLGPPKATSYPVETQVPSCKLNKHKNKTKYTGKNTVRVAVINYQSIRPKAKREYTCLPVSICSHTQELTPYKLLNMSLISLNFTHLPFLSWSHSSAH